MDKRSQKFKRKSSRRTPSQQARIVEAVEARCLLSAVPTFDHVVIVVEENHSYDEVIGASQAPYINSLASGGAAFTNSTAVDHPSQPNYLALFSGSEQGVSDDNLTGSFNKPNLASSLIAAGKTFGGYSQGLPSTGSLVETSGAYARKHNPWSDFTNVPAADNMPFTAFPSDFTKLPTVSFVVPDINNDMHDGTVKAGDTWLKNNVSAYATWAQTHNSLLIVTWDEDDGSQSNQIPTIFYGAQLNPGTYGESINHYNVLRTVEDMFGVARVGASASATPITDVWQTTVTVPIIPLSDSVAGTTAADSITLTQDADHQHIDWTMGTTTAQMLINDAKGLTITGNGGADKITLNYANGNPLPNQVHLNGNFTIAGLQGTNPLAGTTLDIGTGTIYLTYANAASDPLAAVQGALKTGYNAGKWNGTAAATNGVITSSAAKMAATSSPVTMGIGYIDSADGTGLNSTANTIKLNYTYIGDTGLTGSVGSGDVTRLSRNFGKLTGSTWDMGDFDYNARVSLVDYNALSTNLDLLSTASNTGTGNSIGTGTGTGTGAGTGTGTSTSTGTSTGSSTGAITPIAATAPSSITWSAPIVITKGGTYTGNWQSTNANTPAIEIATSDPVIIINSNIQSRGNLIETSVSHANITIKNSHGWALNPNVRGQSPGRFLDAENFDNIDIENNTMVGTAGIEMGYYAGDGTANNTVKILRNNAMNIDGRWSDGSGGYQTNAAANDYVQFAQFNACHNMTGVEIAWNQVINTPGQSRVEDNISVFQSSGTAASPMLIHDNYIQGAYPADAANDSSYTGGGIMVSDGNTNSASTDTGHVRAYNNVVVGTTNYGIAVSSGLDDQVYNNIVISSGLLPSGQKPASQNVGIYVWNQSGDPFFQSPKVTGNTVGWMGPSGRNDEWTPDASSVSDTSLSGSITQATEQQYYNVWTQRVVAAGQTVGA